MGIGIKPLKNRFGVKKEKNGQYYKNERFSTGLAVFER